MVGLLASVALLRRADLRRDTVVIRDRIRADDGTYLETCYVYNERTKNNYQAHCVFFVPGLATSITINEAMLAVFAEYYPVYSFSYRGHGNSMGTNSLEKDLFVQDTLCVFDHYLGKKHGVYVVGQSLGTFFAPFVCEARSSAIDQVCLLSPTPRTLLGAIKTSDHSISMETLVLLLCGVLLTTRASQALWNTVWDCLWSWWNGTLYEFVHGISWLLEESPPLHKPTLLVVPHADMMSNPQELVEEYLDTEYVQVRFVNGVHGMEAIPLLDQSGLRTCLTTLAGRGSRDTLSAAGRQRLRTNMTEIHIPVPDDGMCIRPRTMFLPLLGISAVIGLSRDWVVSFTPFAELLRRMFYSRLLVPIWDHIPCTINGWTYCNMRIHAVAAGTCFLYLFCTTPYSTHLLQQAVVHFSAGTHRHVVRMSLMKYNVKSSTARLELCFSTNSLDTITDERYPSHQSCRLLDATVSMYID